MSYFSLLLRSQQNFYFKLGPQVCYSCWLAAQAPHVCTSHPMELLAQCVFGAAVSPAH